MVTANAIMMTIAVVAEPRLTTAGAIIMAISVIAVLTLTAFCVIRVLTLPPVEMEDIKGPLAIDTGDTENAD
jgi:hypothetical protein